MKRFLVVMMAVVALTSLLAVPTFAADKLIVRNAGGSADVFKVTDAGQIVLPAASGVNRDSGIQNPGTADNFSMIGFYPQSAGPNVGSALQVIPKGTGFNASRKAQLSLFNTDFVADPANWEAMVIAGQGATGFTFNTSAAGTGVVRPIGFQIGNATKMTIAANGNVGIGTTSPAFLLDVNGQIRVQTTVYSSSRTLKDNITDLRSSEAMEALEKLDPVKFNYKNSPDVSHIGFIAEDVPGLVAQKNRDTIDPMDIVAVLTKVVQEQNKTITELSGKLNKLEAQVTRIKSRDMFGSVEAGRISGN